MLFICKPLNGVKIRGGGSRSLYLIVLVLEYKEIGR